MNNKLLLPLLLFTIIGCSEGFNVEFSFGDSKSESSNLEIDNAFASTYAPMNSEPMLFKSANIYDGLGGEFRNYDLLLSEGKIIEIGESITAPGVMVIDATDKWITPGIIDIHSHMGVYSAPGVSTSSDGNEATSPVTAEVWAEHSLWTQDPQFALALKGGVTAFHVLPGSANLFGGRGATFKNVSQNTVQAMKFPGAPHSLKMACGENPKRVYGNRRQAPSTRMGNMAGYRTAWIEAAEYTDGMNEKDSDRRPTRDLAMDTLMGVLNGEILIQNHCYRAEEMAMMIELSKEFGNTLYIYRLPGIFGKWCKPNYNSVVATFCHKMARGEPIQISSPEREIKLVYIDDVISSFIETLQSSSPEGSFFNKTFSQTKVSILYQKKLCMHNKFNQKNQSNFS